MSGEIQYWPEFWPSDPSVLRREPADTAAYTPARVNCSLCAIARGGIHPPARDETAAFGATLAPRFAQDFVDAVAAANPAAATSASKHVAFISCRRIARESA